MTTPEAGRVEDRMAVIRADVLKPGHLACDSCRDEVTWMLDALTTQAETIREQAQAIRDHKFTLQTQAQTIRRMEREHLAQLGAENAAYQREYRRAEEAAETIRRLEGEREREGAALVAAAEFHEHLKQRAEVAEHEVTRLQQEHRIENQKSLDHNARLLDKIREWRQRAEAAEAEAARVAKLVRCGWPPCAQATDVRGPFICINHKAVYGPTT